MTPTAQHTPPAAAASPPPLSSPYFGRYLCVLFLLPLVVLLGTFPFAASQTFLRLSRRELWHATHYRYILPSGQNCDVVIAGDSSGMIGVDPETLQQRTKWKTCNVALPYVSTALAGTRVLDYYLAHNRPPRFIVFHLSGNHLRAPRVDEDNGIIDAWLMADEHFPARETVRILVTHPRNSLRLAAAVWKEFLTTKPILRPDWSGATYRRDMQTQMEGRGWMPQHGTTTDIVCGWQPGPIHTERAYLDAVVARYTRENTQAVVWANPARDCDLHIAEYRHNSAMLGLAPAQVYDRSLFFDAFHLNTDGAASNATALAAYLQSRENQN